MRHRTSTLGCMLAKLVIALATLTLIGASPAYATSNIVIGGFNAARGGAYSLDNLPNLSAALLADFPGSSISTAATLTSSYLATLNIVILGSATGSNSCITPLSSSEQSALMAFAQSGGTAVILTDNDTFCSGASMANNSLVSPFGLHATGILNGNQQMTFHLTSPVDNGPFGSFTTAETNYPGWYDSIGSAIQLATLDFNGESSAAILPAGAMSATSGNVVFFSDSEFLADTSGNDRTALLNSVFLATVGQFAVLHTFTGAADGGLPFAGMITDSAGNLYGTAGAGGTGSCSYFGTTGCGTVFELKKHNSSFLFSPLYSFQGGTDGEFSIRPMTLGPNGTYYGATAGGGEGACSFDGVPECGVVFNVGSSPTPQRTPLLKFIEHGIPYRFTGGSDGATPFTTLIFDSAGDIYGTTNGGGAHGFGTVFELIPSGGGNYSERVLWNFAGGNDGAYPDDGLIPDSAGNFYGTTSAGGSTTACSGAGCGTVFKLTPTGGGNYSEAPIYRFQGTSDGENPNAGVAMDGAGNLYGNTWQGGNGGGGTVYELTPNGSNWTFNLLYSVPNAGFAVGRVVLDSSGNVYEALQNGGAFSNNGQVLELMHSGSNWIYIDLHDFTGGTDGKNAIGGVNFDASGNLYGTTTFGAGTGCGGNGCGVVWEIMPTN